MHKIVYIKFNLLILVLKKLCFIRGNRHLVCRLEPSKAFFTLCLLQKDILTTEAQRKGFISPPLCTLRLCG